MGNRFDAPATYEAAAKDYEQASARYWAFMGKRTVDRLNLQTGAWVLDVPCGPGSSALPAAEAVGPEGHVVAVDLAPQMIVLAREKARRSHLTNIEFVLADMTRLDFPSEKFDAVICVLGLFFVEDMVHQAKQLWHLVKPGGQLAITTFERHFFTPLYAIWKEQMQAELQEEELIGPWERTNDPNVMRQILNEAGVPNMELSIEKEELPLPKPEVWWEIVLGTGMRKWVMELDKQAAARVRKQNLRWATEHGVHTLTVSSIYATATKESKTER